MKLQILSDLHLEMVKPYSWRIPETVAEVVVLAGDIGVGLSGVNWEDGMTVKAVWHIMKESARSIGVAKLAPHDLRRTCARLCHASGGELEQIQFLLGHVSVQTT